MKKIGLFISVLLALCGVLYGINLRDINDTSNIRISSPALRAELLTYLLKRGLGLDAQTVEMLKSHNEKYEAQLQQLVEDNPPALFSAAKPKKKGDDVFDEFAKMRAAELRQILNTKYTDFEKKQFMVRNDLKKGILAYNEEQIKKEQAQREAMAVAAAQRKAAKLAKTQTENQKKKAKEAAKGKKNKGDKKKGKKKK